MLNFSKINAFEQGQRESFEELVCILAKRYCPRGGIDFQRIEGSGGDGGVEALWLRDDGTKLGYQAKFFLQLGTKQWSQIDSSVKRALEVHPEITDYVVALPINLTHKRAYLGLGSSAWEKWEAFVKKWTSWAKAKGISVKFKAWTATEISEILLREENHGLVLHWFGEKILGTDFFRKQFFVSKKLLEERYSPSEHVHTAIEALFDAMVRGPSTMAQIRVCYADLEKNRFPSLDFKKISLQPNPSVIDQAERAWIALLETEKLFSQDYRKEWDIATVCEASDIYREALRSLEAVLEAAKQNPDTKEKTEDLNEIEHRLSNARNSVYRLKVLTQSKTLRAERARFAVVTGPAGAGKSHLLAHVADQRLENTEPTVLLIGQTFSEADIWVQIAAQLNLPLQKSADVLNLLNAAAERQAKRALIMIDALNEGIGARFWRDRVAGLLTQANDYPHLVFVFSCREEYLPFAFPRSIIDDVNVFRVEGFQTIEEMEAAAERYLDSKGIARPNTPWLSPEFRNPLFLKSTSEALQARGEVEFPKGLHGISQLMSFYLDSLSLRTGLSNVDYDLLATAIKRVVQNIAAKMVENGQDYLELALADQIANKTFASLPISNDTTWLSVLTRSSIIRRDPPPFNKDNDPLNLPQDRIRFAFQRFQDHLMAQAIINQTQSDRLRDAFEPGGALSFLVCKGDAGSGFAYEHAGLLGALSTLYPERFGVEFADTVPDCIERWSESHMLQEAYETSCKWRRLDAFSARSLELLNSLDDHWVDKLALLVEVSMTIDHPWNASFLHEWLFNQAMPDRDSYWTVWINWASVEEGNQVDRLISWANGSGKADVRHLELAALTISWMLTSSRKSARDRASKALTSIFLRGLEVFPIVLERLAACNDPYLVERLYAAAFGACCLDQSSERLNSYATSVWGACFARGEPPVALLTRDYALGIIELAEAKKCLGDNVNIGECLPPFRSTPPDLKISMGQVEQIAKDRGASAILRSASNEWGDFGKYTIPGRVRPFLVAPLSGPAPVSAEEIKHLFVKEVVSPHPERVAALAAYEDVRRKPQTWMLRIVGIEEDTDSDAEKDVEVAADELLIARKALEVLLSDPEMVRFSTEFLREGRSYSQYENIDVQQCRLWITKRAYELGWTNERFPRDGHGTYGSGSENDLERIGKKYQRIALDEIVARLSDNYWYLNDWPEVPIVYRYSHQNFYRDIEATVLAGSRRFGASSHDDENWMIEPIIRLPEVREEGLKGWPFEKDPTVDLHESLLRIDKNGARWRVLYEFNCARENYSKASRGLHQARCEEFRFIYCAIVNEADANKFTTELNLHKHLDVSDFNPREYTDGPFLLEAYWRDTWQSKKFSEQIRGAPSELKFSNPVARYYWEGHMDKTIPNGFGVCLPQKWLAADLGITISQKSIRSWVDSNGIELIKVLSPSEMKAAVLIREDSFLEYCRRCDLTPIWLLIGERNAWPGGNNDESCWRRSEGAWWQSKGRWKHIAWNHDTVR